MLGKISGYASSSQKKIRVLCCELNMRYFVTERYAFAGTIGIVLLK